MPGHRIPLWLKIAYTAFMAVLIPIYLKNYGPTNFLYFCDVAAIMTIVGIWLESPLLLSAPLVGIFLPQMLWVVDFFFTITGGRFTGMTEYMVQPPFFLRFLSFFHFWLPFLLIYLVWKVGYDKRGLVLWTGIAWVLITVCYLTTPVPSPVKDEQGVQLRDPNIPVNVDYVYGFSEEEEQTMFKDRDVYFAVYMVALVMVIFLPTHFLCRMLLPQRSP